MNLQSNEESVLEKVRLLEEENTRLRESIDFHQSKINSIKANLHGFVGVLNSISWRLSNQILGNVEVLTHVSAKECNADGVTLLDSDGKPKELKAFQSDSVRLLVCEPIHILLGRFNGLKQSVLDIKNRL